MSAARVAPSVERRASEWLILMQEGEPTAEQRGRFEAWLREDASHRAAYEGMAATWARLTTLSERARAAGAASVDPDALPKALQPARERPRRTLAWAGAAAAAIAVLAAGWSLYPRATVIPYRTAVGERAAATLPDGSSIELNTDTAVEVRYSHDLRRVALQQGEAYFNVAHDAGRPFVVVAGPGAVRAVGTGFVVRMKSADAVAVTVRKAWWS